MTNQTQVFRLTDLHAISKAESLDLPQVKAKTLDLPQVKVIK